MASRAQQAKVLRIAILQDGKMVQERLMRPGEPVTIGESSKNTFVLPKTPLKQGSFPLFKATGDGYVLRFTEDMKGRITSGGPVTVLDRVRSDPSVQKEGDAWQLDLSDQDRGKITLGNVAVLFQFVPPPPEQAVKPIQAMSFRPRLLEDDDPVFLGFLAVFAAVGAIVFLWVLAVEPPETMFEEVPDRWVELVIEEVPEPEVAPEEDPEPGIGEADPEPDVEPEPDPEPVEVEPTETVEDAQRREEMREQLLEEDVMLSWIAHTGDDRGGRTVASAGDPSGDIDLGGADGVDASGGPAGPRAGPDGERGPADIGGMARAGDGAGEADLGSAPAVAAEVDLERPSYFDDSDPSHQREVRRVVQANEGQLRYCYESRLRQNPDLRGRVEVEWRIVNGRVQDAMVVANSSGDSELATCIVNRIQRWNFPPAVSAEPSWPFVFRPSG